MLKFIQRQLFGRISFIFLIFIFTGSSFAWANMCDVGDKLNIFTPNNKKYTGISSIRERSKAINWRKVTVPGAKCGDGSEYVIFIDAPLSGASIKERSSRVIFMFQGGGVCWDEETCKGYINLSAPTKVIPHDISIGQGIFSAKDTNPFLNYTKVYLPYCTADVFVGGHKAKYGDLNVLHNGQKNTELVLQYLKSLKLVDIKPELPNEKVFDFGKTKNLVIYGFSAGAIGALSHIHTIAPYFKQNANLHKSVVADAPGFHFGNKFWKKFSTKFHHDFKETFSKFDYPFNPSNGLVAPIIPKVCSKYPDWNIGVLQASHDPFMACIYGNIYTNDHAKLVLNSARGLANLTSDPTDNCSAWVEIETEPGRFDYEKEGGEATEAPDTNQSWINIANHTYLIAEDTSNISVMGKTAMQYVWDLATSDKPLITRKGVTDNPIK